MFFHDELLFDKIKKAPVETRKFLASTGVN